MDDHDALLTPGRCVQFCQKKLPRRTHQRALLAVFALVISVILSACAPPLVPYSVDTPPLVLVPASVAGVQDKRGRFREIFCQVLEARGSGLPDYRPCDEALTRVGAEPAGTGEGVELGPSRRRLIAALVPGVGWDCFADWLELQGSVTTHVRQFGYDQITLTVDGLSAPRRCAVLLGGDVSATRAHFPGALGRLHKLSRVDARNDSQVLFYNQVIPGSTLVGYLNADHWALAVPVSRSHPWLGSTLLNHNGYPREALLEALLRFVEWDLTTRGRRH
jgi:hypothetical protein